MTVERPKDDTVTETESERVVIRETKETTVTEPDDDDQDPEGTEG